MILGFSTESMHMKSYAFDYIVSSMEENCTYILLYHEILYEADSMP